MQTDKAEEADDESTAKRQVHFESSGSRHPQIMRIGKQSTQVNKIGDGETPHIVDSGAEINTIPVAMMVALEAQGYRIVEAAITDKVMFGKEDNIEDIAAWVLTDSVLGRIAVVDMGVAIVSVAVITRNGIQTVEFSDVRVTMKTADKQTVVVGEYDQEARMYTIDIGRLLMIKGTQGEYEEPRAIRVTRRATPRHSAQAVRTATRYHENMCHIPYSAMAIQVEDEVWDLGADVTPALLRHLGAKDSCVICSMTRRQHKPREGTGTMRWKVGEQFSFDYQGKYTPASQGKSGYNLITDGGCKALQVYGQKEKMETEDTIKDYVAQDR